MTSGQFHQPWSGKLPASVSLAPVSHLKTLYLLHLCRLLLVKQMELALLVQKALMSWSSSSRMLATTLAEGLSTPWNVCRKQQRLKCAGAGPAFNALPRIGMLTCSFSPWPVSTVLCSKNLRHQRTVPNIVGVATLALENPNL